MDDESRARFEQFEKRLDDQKFFISVVAGVAAAIFGVVALIFALNLNAEKKDLREYKKELKEELGKTVKPPEMDALTLSREALKADVVVVKAQMDEDSRWFLEIPFILVNSGGSNSGEISMKFYTTEPLKIGPKSSDEDEYNYEHYVPSEENSPSRFPAGLSIAGTTTLTLLNETKPPKGRYKVLQKIFYKGKVSRIPFFLKIDDTANH